MSNILIPIMGVALAIFLPAILIYFFMMFINNIIWGYKGRNVDKQSTKYKKLRRKLFVISILISIVGVIILVSLTGNKSALNQTGSTSREQVITPVSFDNCEFIVNFPTETKQKAVSQSGMEFTRIESVSQKGTPYLRAECVPMMDGNIGKTVEALPNIMKTYAAQLGINNPEITTEKNELGTIGKFSGLRKAGGYDVMYVGKVYAGSRSVLTLLSTELASRYPSEKNLIFLNSVSTKKTL